MSSVVFSPNTYECSVQLGGGGSGTVSRGETLTLTNTKTNYFMNQQSGDWEIQYGGGWAPVSSVVTAIVNNDNITRVAGVINGQQSDTTWNNSMTLDGSRMWGISLDQIRGWDNSNQQVRGNIQFGNYFTSCSMTKTTKRQNGEEVTETSDPIGFRFNYSPAGVTNPGSYTTRCVAEITADFPLFATVEAADYFLRTGDASGAINPPDVIPTEKNIFDFDNITVVLSNRAHEHLGILKNIDPNSVNITVDIQNGYQLSFDVYHTLDGFDEPLWDKIVDLKLIYVPEIDDFLSITSNLSDTLDEKKSITAVSAGIAELSQTIIYNLEINTEDDILREDYTEPTLFYNPENPEASLLNRVLYKMPQWSIGHVDEQLQHLQRTLSADNVSVWDFLSGDVAEQFDCLFKIDSVNRTINVFDLLVYCHNCNTRQDFYFSNNYENTRLQCKNTASDPSHHQQQNLSYYGDDTTILIDKENLTNEIQLTVDSAQIKNTFKLVGGDDLMTATIQACNPNGSDYITQFNQYDYDDMPDDLVDKLMDYQALYNSLQPSYMNIMQSLYDALDDKIELESTMMPVTYVVNPTIEETIDDLEDGMDGVGTIALNTLTPSTTKATVSSTVTSLARIFIRTDLYKVDLYKDPNTGLDDVTWNPPSSVGGTGTWSGTLTVTKYKNEVETANTKRFTFTVSSDRESYLNQRIMKNLIKANDNDLTYDVLSKSIDHDYAAFKEAISHYCLNRLISFRDALQGCLDILIQEGESDVVSEFREDIYVPYHHKLELVNAEIADRQAEINDIQEDIDSLEAQRDSIQNTLNFEAYLGSELFNIYCSYRREDTYQNSNFISDGLETNDLFKRAQEFLDLANKELAKASTPQYTIATTLFNLINYNPEYKFIKDNFKIGNWLRVKVDDVVYRLRLVSASMSLGSPESLSVEFSNITAYNGIANDVKSVLSKAQSMSTTYTSTQKQTASSYGVANSVRDFYKTGLLSVMNNLKNNDDEEISVDRFGILGRSYDMDTDTYSPEQIRITHNLLAFTDDGWSTASAAIGKHKYSYYDSYNERWVNNAEGYGLTAKFVQAGYISGSQIVGGDLYSTNYTPSTAGSHINLNNGYFELAGGKFNYNGSTLSLNNGNIEVGGVNGGSISIKDSTGTKELVKLDASGMTLDSSVKISYENNIIDKPDIPDTSDLVDSVIPIYYAQLSTSSTPTLPISKVEDSSGRLNKWTTKYPTLTEAQYSNNYVVYTCNQTVAVDGTLSYSELYIPTTITKNVVSASYINAIGINADNIKAGTIKADIFLNSTIEVGGSSTRKDGVISVKNESGTELVRLDKKGITLASSVEISYSNITNTPTIPTTTSQLTNDSGFINGTQATTITQNTVTTSYIDALNVTAYDVKAHALEGKTITGGRINGSIIHSVGNYYSSYQSHVKIYNGRIDLWKDNTTGYTDNYEGTTYITTENIQSPSVSAKQLIAYGYNATANMGAGGSYRLNITSTYLDPDTQAWNLITLAYFDIDGRLHLRKGLTIKYDITP